MQIIFNRDKIQDTIRTPDKNTEHSDTWTAPFCIVIIMHELQTFKNYPDFFGPPCTYARRMV